MDRPQNRHLKPFRPGAEWNGYRGGRKPGRSLTAMLREVMEGTSLAGMEATDGRTVGELFVEACVAHAMKGNAAYAKEVWARLDGVLVAQPPEKGDTVTVEYIDEDPNSVAEAAPGATDGQAGSEPV